MSSFKDYAFEVVTNTNASSVTFVVRNRPSFFLRHVRVPLACVSLACAIPQAIRNIQRCLEISGSELSGLLWKALSGNFFDTLRENLGSLAFFVFLISIGVLLSLDEPADTLMVMEDMGIQISSKSRWRPLNIGRNGKFVPISEIIDIVIHEGFHGYGQVIYYMCVLTRDKDKGEGNGVQVIFPNFLPRKDILLQVWKSSRQMLYGKTRRHYRHVPGHGLREVQHLHD